MKLICCFPRQSTEVFSCWWNTKKMTRKLSCWSDLPPSQHPGFSLESSPVHALGIFLNISWQDFIRSLGWTLMRITVDVLIVSMWWARRWNWRCFWRCFWRRFWDGCKQWVIKIGHLVGRRACNWTTHFLRMVIVLEVFIIVEV